jgi:hypothetical protein
MSLLAFAIVTPSSAFNPHFSYISHEHAIMLSDTNIYYGIIEVILTKNSDKTSYLSFSSPSKFILQ